MYSRRKTLQALSVSAGAITLLASPVLAQTAQPNAETITVTATRTPQATSQIGASITIIGAEAITQSQAINVDDLLRTVPSVSISRNGGQGGLTSVRIRGAEGDQTLVLIDGIKINDPASPGGGFDFGTLLVGDVAQIDVLRGPQSTLYGSQAIGGVVNVITQAPRAALEGSFDAEAGELASHRVRGSIRGRLAGFSYAGALGYVSSDSVSSAAVGQETDGFEQKAGQGRLGYKFNQALEVEGRLWWAKSEVGIDGFPPPSFAFSDTAETSRNEQIIGYLGAKLSLLDGRSQTRFGISRATTDRVNSDPTSSVRDTFLALGTNEQVDIVSTLDISPMLQVVGGGEVETSRLRVASPSSFNPNPTPLRAEVQTNSFYLQAQVTPAPWLTTTLGVRHTSNSRFGDAFTARATLAARLNDGNTILRAAFANGFKAPTLFQSFSDFGNAFLKAEEAASGEFGIEQAFFARKLSVAMTYFKRDTINQIDFASCFGVTSTICVNRPFGVYDNIAKAKAEGFEATLSYKPTANFDLSAGFTALETDNLSPGSNNFGKQLSRRPRQSGYINAAYVFDFGLSVSATYSRTGPSFNDGANRTRLAGFDLISVRVSQEVSQIWSIYARVDNAGDEIYQTAAGYGSMPRQMFVGLRATF
jgi:vitamin B12 transporter